MSDTCVLCLNALDDGPRILMTTEFVQEVEPSRWIESGMPGGRQRRRYIPAKERQLGGSVSYVHARCMDGFNHRWHQAVGCSCAIGHVNCCLSE